METKEQVESLQFIVSTHRREFENRRSFQWKAISGILILLGLSMAARVNTKSQEMVDAIPDWTIWTAVMAIPLIGSLFLYFVCTANAFNKSVAHRAEKAIQDAINGELQAPLSLYDKPEKHTIRNLFKIGNGGYWGWLFESTVLFVFAIITATVLTS